MRSKLIAAALALGSSTCCPSLFLSVEKLPAGPQPSLPAAVVADEPIPMPPHLDNRLLVRNAAPVELDRDYADAVTVERSPLAGPAAIDTTDAPDGGDPAPIQLSRETSDALVALSGIARERGVPGAPALPQRGLRGPLPATLKCRPHRGCPEIRFNGPAPTGGSVFVKIAHDDADQSDYLDEIMQYGPVDAEGIEGGPRRDEYYLILRHPISGTNGQAVRIWTSAALPRLSIPLLSFIHITDAQIRDSSVRLGNRDLGRRLDRFFTSAGYDTDLELYNRYLVESLFATINAEVRKRHSSSAEQPSFVIHTGDAVDAGVTSELREFHRLIDLLSVPVYNVIGNHDVLTFGNVMPTHDPRSDKDCASVESIAQMKNHWYWPFVFNKLCINARIRCHDKADCVSGDVELIAAGPEDRQITHASARQRFMDGFRHGAHTLVPTSRTGGEPCGVVPAVPTRQHGFDLPAFDPENHPGMGYYAFVSKLETVPDPRAPRCVYGIVLDVEDLEDGKAGVAGRIGRTQIQWLDKLLERIDRRDLVVVFSHDEISAVSVERAPGNAVSGPVSELERILDRHPNVIAYFYGHHHHHEICRDHRATACRHFWEIQTASLIEFPQEARRIRIKYAGNGLAFLELVSFREQLASSVDARAKAVELARRGAERDLCRTVEGTQCSEDLRVYRSDGRDANARLWFTLPGWQPAPTPESQRR